VRFVTDKPEGAGRALAPLGLILTHGRLGEELKQTAELILGGAEGIVAVSNTGSSSAELAARVGELIRGEPRERPILILVDLLGGSCAQACAEALREPRIRLLTGVNLPMVLAFLQYREAMSLDELVDGVFKRALRGITVYPLAPVSKAPAVATSPASSSPASRPGAGPGR
jgi:mannose/fructose-specific phosphotransferase system component IIA